MAEFMGNSETIQRLLNIAESVVNNAQSTQSTDPIIPIRFDEEIYKEAKYEAPFLEFLKQKGRVKSTDSAKTGYKKKSIKEKDRAKFGNETASDIAGTDVKWDTTEYLSETIGKKIGVSDMAQMGNPDTNLIADDRSDAFLDVQSAIDEGLFHRPSGSNKFDGIFNTTKHVVDLKGDVVTCDIVDEMIEQIGFYGNKVDGIVCTGNAVSQIIKSDDAKKVYDSKEEPIPGVWATKYRTPNGIVPLVIDGNINSRIGVPDENSNAVIPVTSRSLMGRVLMEAAAVKLAKVDLSESEIIASFMSFCNVDPYGNGVIKGVGSSYANDSSGINPKTLTVTVEDDNNVALDDIPVKLLNSSRSQVAERITDASGVVAFDGLTNTNYYLRINKQAGYKSFEDYEVDLSVDDEATLTLVSE